MEPDASGDDGRLYRAAQLTERTYQRALQRFGPADGELLAVALLEEQAGLRLRHDSPASDHGRYGRGAQG
jgi:hypothetical protein